MLGGSLGGAVFVCSAGTVQSCLQKGLLGMMQDTYIPIVQHVSVGMPVRLAGPHVPLPAQRHQPWYLQSCDVSLRLRYPPVPAC